MKSGKTTTHSAETMTRTEIKIRTRIFRAVQDLLFAQGKTFGQLPMTSRFFDEAAEEKLKRELRALERKKGA